MLDRLFLAHPRTVGESYTEHCATASRFGFSMIRAGIACLIHGIFPWMFVTTGSDTIRRLHGAMVTHRQVHSVPQTAGQTAQAPDAVRAG